MWQISGCSGIAINTTAVVGLMFMGEVALYRQYGCGDVVVMSVDRGGDVVVMELLGVCLEQCAVH